MKCNAAEREMKIFIHKQNENKLFWETNRMKINCLGNKLFWEMKINCFGKNLQCRFLKCFLESSYTLNTQQGIRFNHWVKKMVRA